MIVRISHLLLPVLIVVASGNPLPGVAITTQPEKTNVPLHTETWIGVEAEGAEPITYQWYRNGVLLPEATEKQFIVAPRETAGKDIFQVKVGDAASTILSDRVELTVFDIGELLGIPGYAIKPYETPTKIYSEMYHEYKEGIHLRQYSERTFAIAPWVMRKSNVLEVTLPESSLVTVSYNGGLSPFAQLAEGTTNNNLTPQPNSPFPHEGEYTNYLMGEGPLVLNLAPYDPVSGYRQGASVTLKNIEIIPIPQNYFLADSYRQERIEKGSFTEGAIEELDFDEDGRNNLLEWMQSTNPFEVDSAPEPTIETLNGKQVRRFRFRRPWNIHPYTYVLEASTDQLTWTKVENAPVSESPWMGGKEVSIYDTVPIGSVPERFLRIHVIRVE